MSTTPSEREPHSPALSSPVVGTPVVSGILENGQNALSRNLSRRAWLALANAAQALADVARAALQQNGLCPVDALSLTHTHPEGLSVGNVVNEFLEAKERAGRSKRYIRALRNSLGKFCRGRSKMALAAVTTAEVENWLHKSKWAARTKAGYLGDVRTLFAWALRRGYVSENVALAVDVARGKERAPGVHTPEEVRTVLETARRMDLNVCRCLAVRYFAGLRASEAERLEEADIKLAEGLISVQAEHEKRRKRRLVTVQPALLAWLELGGKLPLANAGQKWARLARAVKAKGTGWPHNAPRHSFCSYHLAMWRKASETALEAGHSEAMLFRHYRALVSKAEAEKFWAIRPGP